MTLTIKAKSKRQLGKVAKYYSLTPDKEGCHKYYVDHIIDTLVKQINN